MGGTSPADFVGRQLVAATSGAGGEMRYYDDSVVEGVTEKGGGEGGAEVIVGVAAGAVDDDESAGDLGIGDVQGIRAIDHGAGGSAREGDPFGAVGDAGARRGAECGRHEAEQ